MLVSKTNLAMLDSQINEIRMQNLMIALKKIA
jgi:hypothetical protein